ncbi:MAG: hypothetical protein ACREVW_07775, partial [Burkholderiales bacterium]
MNAIIEQKKPETGLKGNVVDYLFELCMAPEQARRPYLITRSGTSSFGDVYRRACQVGRMLQARGVQPGERVM